MNFLYPQNAVFGLAVLIVLLFNRKIKFTHLEFFKHKKFFYINILDILILLSLTLLIMYPVTNKTINIPFATNYSLNLNRDKKHVIIILDVSTSMEKNVIDNQNYFEEEKENAIYEILKNKGNYIMLVVFEGDYKIIQDFTIDTRELISKVNSLKTNMVTNVGGSMIRDTVAGIINSFAFLNPEIIVHSDGCFNDDSSISKKELKKLASKVNIRYIPYGIDKENDFYLSIFKPKKTKQTKLVNKNKTLYKTVQYQTFDNRFIFLALILLIIKILKVRFENRFNFT